jgi:predicted amidohydrolase YtcJ
VEHAQVVHPDDFDKFEKYSIIPSVQSTHATSDMYWAVSRVGEERIKGAYAQQTLLKQNGWLINGTDFPIEGINPIHTFYAAISRKDPAGYPEGGFLPGQAFSREEALKSITIWAAKGSFEEHVKGSIEAGKHADFVILDRNIMEMTEADILYTQVIATFVHGERVFQIE